MTGLLIALAVIASVVAVVATRRRRHMRRHAAPTFVFADLVGYTAVADREGDAAAARIAHEFRRTMGKLSRQHGAWQVKSMGDGVMIWASDPARAMRLAARTVELVGTRDDLLPVRVGVHTGSAVMRGCDWYGSAVNIAARLAAQAAPNEALVSVTTRTAAAGADTPQVTGCRQLRLRGVARPVSAWRLA